MNEPKRNKQTNCIINIHECFHICIESDEDTAASGVRVSSQVNGKKSVNRKRKNHKKSNVNTTLIDVTFSLSSRLLLLRFSFPFANFQFCTYTHTLDQSKLGHHNLIENYFFLAFTVQWKRGKKNQPHAHRQQINSRNRINWVFFCILRTQKLHFKHAYF